MQGALRKSLQDSPNVGMKKKSNCNPLLQPTLQPTCNCETRSGLRSLFFFIPQGFCRASQEHRCFCRAPHISWSPATTGKAIAHPVSPDSDAILGIIAAFHSPLPLKGKGSEAFRPGHVTPKFENLCARLMLQEVTGRTNVLCPFPLCPFPVSALSNYTLVISISLKAVTLAISLTASCSSAFCSQVKKPPFAKPWQMKQVSHECNWREFE